MQRRIKPPSRLGAGENTSMPSCDLRVVYRRIEALKPDPANPRLHSKKQIRQIADSIETFGFNVPVLVDAELKVICGHCRLLACHELGWTEVPTCMGLFLSSDCFWVFLTVLCSERERPFFVPSPAIRFPERAEGVKGPKR